MKKVLIGAAVVLVIVLAALYIQHMGSVSQTASSDDSFQNDAAVILASSSLSPQAKIDQLNARLAAKRLNAAKAGGVYHTAPNTAGIK